MFEDPAFRDNILTFWNSIMENISIPDQFQKYLNFLPIFFLGFVATFILTPIIGNFAKQKNIVYIPNSKRKDKDFENSEKAMHEGIIPALGGLAVSIPLFLVIIFFFKVDSITLPFLVALGILTLGGVLDDILDIPAKTQLFFQIAAAIVISFSLLDFSSFTVFGLSIPMDIFSWQPIIGNFAFSLTFPGDLLLFAWLIFCINSFKWTGGSPGLIEGNALVIAFLIFVISIRFQTLFPATIGILLSGSLFAFLIFAYPPPLIMSGSPGKSVYGLLLCTLGLISQTKFATTLILLLLPSLDAVFVLVKRYITYKPKNPFDLMKISDTTHFHHHLLKMDFSRKQVFWIEMLITLAIGSLAIITTGAYRYLFLLLGILTIASLLFFTSVKSQQKSKESVQKESSESKYSY